MKKIAAFIAIGTLLCSSSALAALKDVQLTNLPSSSDGVTFRLAEKVNKGPIRAGETVNLTPEELRALDNQIGLIDAFTSNGIKIGCPGFPVKFNGFVIVQVIMKPGKYECHYNTYSKD